MRRFPIKCDDVETILYTYLVGNPCNVVPPVRASFTLLPGKSVVWRAQNLFTAALRIMLPC